MSVEGHITLTDDALDQIYTDHLNLSDVKSLLIRTMATELRALRAWKAGLHGRMMNLPYVKPHTSRYAEGHRDARHAAAEMVGEKIGGAE